MPSKATAGYSDETVRTRAYLLWEADGRPFGRDEHYWGLALAETVKPAPKAKQAAAASAVPEKKKAAAKAAKAVTAPASKAKPKKK